MERGVGSIDILISLLGTGRELFVSGAAHGMTYHRLLMVAQIAQARGFLETRWTAHGSGKRERIGAHHQVEGVDRVTAQVDLLIARGEPVKLGDRLVKG